jgi:hypothetical protein
MHLKAFATFGLLLAVLGACTPALQPPAGPEPAPSLDDEFYRAAATRGERVYRIDTARSLGTVRTYRAGALARIGHDHVIASRDLRGYVVLPADPRAARADLLLPLDTLSVDKPALRAVLGLTSTPTAADIEGTRTNMLDRTLDAVRYPYLSIRLGGITGALPVLAADADIRLHGRTHRQSIGFDVDTGGGELRVTGQFILKQTDFGIAPFSVLGGALQVADGLEVRFEILAVPLPALP